MHFRQFAQLHRFHKIFYAEPFKCPLSMSFSEPLMLVCCVCVCARARVRAPAPAPALAREMLCVCARGRGRMYIPGENQQHTICKYVCAKVIFVH